MSHVVLNSHSLPFNNRTEAEQGFLTFLEVLRKCQPYALKILLLDEQQYRNLYDLELSTNYYVRDWYDLSKKDSTLKDWVRVFLAIETKQPLFEPVDMESIDGNLEVGLESSTSPSQTLLAAYYFNTFLISFTSNPLWLQAFVKVWVLDLGSKEQQKIAEIPNVSHLDTLEQHQALLLERRNALLNTADAIWRQREALFPNLCLLSNQIGSALQTWSGQTHVLNKARHALNVIQEFAQKWVDGTYQEYRHEYLRDRGLDVSGESSSVANDSRKRQARMFYLPDGRHVFFEYHIKLPNGYRMHFYPDADSKQIYVAYLGVHLPL